MIERQTQVLAILKLSQAAQLEDLAQELGVSTSTIRRDVDALEQQGLVTRTHGGVMLNGAPRNLLAKAITDEAGAADPHPKAGSPLADRMADQVNAKQAIGQVAAAMVQPNMTVLLDGGSTVVYAAKQITARPLQVVTNSLTIANHFADDDQVELLVIGGNLYPRTGVLVGEVALRAIESLHADLLLFSLAAIFDDAAYNINQSMAQIEQAMIRQAARSVLLMDHTKFGHKSLVRVARLAEIDHIISDRSLHRRWRDQLGKKLTIAG